MKRTLCVMLLLMVAAVLGWRAGAQSPVSGKARGIERVTRMSLLVKEQNEALRWYTEVLGFEKRGDDRSRKGFWWLTVAPKIVLLLADKESLPLVGKQPTSVVATRDCRGTYEELKARGVKFVSPPMETTWGVSAVFVDLYGNGYNLIEPKAR